MARKIQLWQNIGVCVAKQAGFSHIWSQTLEVGFFKIRLILNSSLTRETLTLLQAINRGASLIRAFVIRCLENIIVKLDACKILLNKLVSVAE